MAAETVAGLLLLASGGMLLRRGIERARMWSALALGALLYTGINSAGYYADLGAWGAVVALVGLAVVAASAFGALVRGLAPDIDRVAEETHEADQLVP